MSDERTRDPGSDWPTDPNDAEGNLEWARQRGWLAESISVTDSPIEAIFICHLIAQGDFGPPQSGLAWEVTAQERVRCGAGVYRIDVAVRGNGIMVAVELDGHQFHERTQRQVMRDNGRQRELEAAGWRVVRFSGTEIRRNVNGCVKSLLEVLRRWSVQSPTEAAKRSSSLDRELALLRQQQEAFARQIEDEKIAAAEGLLGDRAPAYSRGGRR